MLYNIYFKDRTKRTVLSYKTLTTDEIEAQVKARPDADEIEAFGTDPNNLNTPGLWDAPCNWEVEK